MTKRLNSKHKVDRRLKVNLWGRPKSPFNKSNKVKSASKKEIITMANL